MMQMPKMPGPMPVGQPQPQAVSPQMMQIGPEISQALQTIAQQLQQGQQPGAPGMPVDRNSPEYKQAMMQQLASTGPMGAVGSVMQQWGDARQKQQQADMSAWMPVVTKG
jgi:hypothetical protein